MSTAEALTSQDDPIESSVQPANVTVLPEINISGLDEHTRQMTAMILLFHPITVATANLHGTNRGNPQVITSIDELNQLHETLLAKKGGQSAVDILCHNLRRIVEETYPEVK